MNVTSPLLGLIVYVPSPGMFTDVSSVGFPVSGAINFAGWAALIVIGTSKFPGMNSGVPVCLAPWISSDVTSSPVGLTGVTVGV